MSLEGSTDRPATARERGHCVLLHAVTATGLRPAGRRGVANHCYTTINTHSSSCCAAATTAVVCCQRKRSHVQSEWSLEEVYWSVPPQVRVGRASGAERSLRGKREQRRGDACIERTSGNMQRRNRECYICHAEPNWLLYSTAVLAF